jgi:dolichyl-phosphate beta-glucosyltransferase
MLSVIIPCYNEEKRIKNNLPHIINYLERNCPNYELIIVVDIGTDKTLEVVREIKNKKTKFIVNKKRMGKGYAIRQGVLESKGNYIFFLDIDLSTPIEEFPKLFQYMGDYDIAIGSRALDESKVIKKKIDRKLLGFLGNVLIQIFLFRGIKDTQCGFKIFKKEVAKKVFSLQKNTGFGFDFEILFLANKFGYKIKEVPITWSHLGDSKVTFTSHFITLYELIKIKINEWKGIYNISGNYRNIN